MRRERIIVGLGNPGAKYRLNRHNAGHLCIDHLASTWACTPVSKHVAQAEILEGKASGTDTAVLLLKPKTFMNLSGTAVAEALQYYHLSAKSLLVIHDEIELPFGEVRLKEGGGHKGHNGIRDIIARLGSSEFSRLRIGVGRPDSGEVADYVLSNFAQTELARWPDVLAKGTAMSLEWLGEIR